MQQTSFPKGYQQVMPYLIIKNGLLFKKFMEEIFEAKEKSIMMRDENTIMHGELQVGESTIMFADSTNEFSQQNAGLFVYVANADDTYSKALEAGAVSIMDMCNQPYGRTGGVKDPFGNTWWITTDV